VGQQHRDGPRRVLGLVLGEPAQLGDGEAGQRHAADGIGPRGRAQLGDEVGRRARRPDVVPEQRRPHDVPRVVEGDHAVLLAGDGDRGDLIQQPATRGLEGAPPVLGIDLGAGGMRSARLVHHGAGVGIADDDLARLGRRVDPGDECHGGSP
jgi:hypothetical protein